MKKKSFSLSFLYYLIFIVLVLLEKSLYFSDAVLPLDYYFLPAFCFERDISFIGFYIMFWLLERAFVCYVDFSRNEVFIRQQAIYSIVRGQKSFKLHLKMLKDNLEANLLFSMIKISAALMTGRHGLLHVVLWGLYYALILTIVSNTLLNLYLLFNSQICFPVFLICMLVYIVLFQKAAYSRMMRDFSIKGNVLLSCLSTPACIIFEIIWILSTLLMTNYLLKRREY